MLRIVVMNPKGGCGKTTLSTNLASYFSTQGAITTLMDLDAQGSSIFWAHKRPELANHIQLVDAHNSPHNVTRSWAIQPPRNTQVLILDTPARPDLTNLSPLLREASVILIPALTNEFDLHAIVNTAQQLQRSLPSQKNIGLVFNRINKNLPYKKQTTILSKEMTLPVIGSLRDSCNYIRAAAKGLGVCEMKGSHYQTDKLDLIRIAQWCEAQNEKRDKRKCQKEGPQLLHHINPDSIVLASTA